MLVHLTPAKHAARIRRSGLPLGAFAFPVLESYTLTHQWTRELVKWKRQPMAGVYFRIADEAPVRFGHYAHGHEESRAAAAVAAIRLAADPRGFEIVMLAPVKPAQVVRIAPVRAVVGWRHMPDAHARPPCGCPACMVRGEPGRRKLRARYEQGEI
jgi:hypothetical protein